jgi:phage baseplate assembly protein gpV
MIANLHRRLAEVERRLRGRSRDGNVVEANEAEGLYRVEFNENGQRFLSPWMRVQAISAGGIDIQAEPKVGQAVTVTSESGDMADGQISLSSFNDSAPRPHDKAGELKIKKGDVNILVSGNGVEIVGSLTITGASVTHNGTNIGDTHTHSGVETGPGDTGEPN